MLKLLGKLKGVNSKSKELDGGDTLHTIELKIELLEGGSRIQELVEHLKDIIQLDIESKQPTLTTPYPDGK